MGEREENKKRNREKRHAENRPGKRERGGGGEGGGGVATELANRKVKTALLPARGGGKTKLLGIEKRVAGKRKKKDCSPGGGGGKDSKGRKMVGGVLGVSKGKGGNGLRGKGREEESLKGVALRKSKGGSKRHV